MGFNVFEISSRSSCVLNNVVIRDLKAMIANNVLEIVYLNGL